MYSRVPTLQGRGPKLEIHGILGASRMDFRESTTLPETTYKIVNSWAYAHFSREGDDEINQILPPGKKSHQATWAGRGVETCTSLL